MRRILSSLLLIALLAPAALAGTIPGLTSKKLDNGLDVIVVENHAVPLVTIEIAVKSGSYVEGPDYNGLSHLYEHMFFKANKVIPSAEKYARRLNELGAAWNGSTQTERVNYYLTVPAENLRESTAFLRDALYYPLFQQKELERERVVVLGEFDRNEANPGFHLFREIDRKLWFQHFSRKNVIGDREVIVTTPREKMVTLKERYYVPNNSALLFAGDVKPEEAFALAAELFGDWKRAANPHLAYPEPAHPPLASSSTLAVIQPVKSVTLQRSWHGPGMTADMPATFAADVFSFIISQPSSRFYRNLVDSGAFDRAFLSYFSQVQTGPISFTGVTSADRFDRAFAAMQQELQHAADDDYFTDEELRFAKDQLEVSEIYSRERTSDFVHSVSFWWATGGLKYFEDYLDNLRKISRADVQSYLRRYVLGKPSVTGVLVSETDLPKLTAIKTAEIIRPAKGSSATAMATTRGSEVATERFDVDGVRVLLRANPQSEVVAAKAFLQGGVAYAGAGRAGLETLMLEIAAKQSEQFPKEKMARELTRLGARIAADTAGPDYATLTLTSLRRNFEESAAIFFDALFHPLIDDGELALARERRLTALAQQEENPDAYLGRLAVENVYGSHPYALDPLGTRERITGTTAADLQKLRTDTILRSRILLVVVGNVTKDEVTRLLRPALQTVPQGSFTPTALAALPDADRASTKLVSRDLPTVYIQGLFPAANIAAEDFPALYVGMTVLGDRLFEEIRVKRNLSYAPGAWVFQRMANVGSLYVTTPDPNAALKVMRDEVRKLQTSPAPESEVRNAASAARTRLLQGLQASADIAAWLGQFEVQTGGWQNFDAFLARINTVTPEEVRQAMDKHARNVDFAVLGNLTGLDEKLLAGF
jgi:zinc protease